MKGSNDDVRGSVAALGNPAVRAAARRGDDIHSSSGVEGLAPITGELRETIRSLAIDDSVLTIGGDDFHRLCDAIDSIHAGLERENAELRERVAVLDNERGNMHDGGSITDELRGYASMCDSLERTSLDVIADRIDAEHESACAEAYGNGVMSVPIALDESQWVKLPVDADGVAIHIGDMMEWTTSHLGVPNVFEVQRIIMDPSGWHLVAYPATYAPEECCHHHAPTVEDVLREFADEMNQNLGMYTGEAIDADEWRDADNKTIAEYAAKLRLAGDAE